MDPYASWVEKQMKQFGLLWDTAREFRTAFRHIGDPNEVVDAFSHLNRSARFESLPSMEHFRELEKATGKKIDWTNLEQWIKGAQGHVHGELEETARACKLLKIDVAGLGLDDAYTKIEEHPFQRSYARAFGPNWQTRLSEIDRTFGLSITSTNKILMDREQFRQAISSRQEKVLQDFDMLRRKQKYLPAFRESWSELGTDARMRILRQYGLPQTPNADIYAYLEGADIGNHPALNRIDLSESDNLPSLLETRCRWPPQRFRRSGGRHHLLSVWAGRKAPIVVKGVSYLEFDDRSSDAAGELRFYGDAVSQVAEHDTPLQISSKLVSPNSLFWQLQGQTEMYRFLGSFADTIPDATKDEAGTVIQDNDLGVEGSPPIARTSFPKHKSDMNINLDGLREMIRTSLDEARDDLWQLRQDPASWHGRIKRMAQGSGSKELLTTLFSRVDIFGNLNQRIGAAIKQIGSPLLTEADEDTMKIAACLDCALSAAFEERLAHFRWIMPPPAGSLTKVGHQLLELIRENDPILRRMGFSAVMRTIDREVVGGRSFPVAVSQILSDLHVLAVCLEEIESHHPSISDWVEYFQMSNSFYVEQTGRLRPWKEMLEKAVKAMEKAGEYNFAGGPQGFWRRLDQQMGKASRNNDALEGVFREIERDMPFRPEQSAPEAATEPMVSVFSKAPPPAATKTQLRRTRQRRGEDQTQNPDRPVERSTQRPSCSSSPCRLPCVKLPESDFWLSLRNDRRNGPQQTFVWDDFCKAMCSIGCSMESSGGSAFRFVLNDSKGGRIFSIGYHKPHGESDETTLNLGQARRLWLRRLERRANLDWT
ncbi:hypothetical protein CGMCC3_g18097 [Colletotrichum fructicola]|uniref:Uncharacterized protein n=1 Tax=Colletotrichum fructicola (strain Nara gc5) TaxID=1213859 RepID=A0A7J6JBW0_COLFN|nr:uncharacterized protein CGMCC3_g18097 [Colletotrichum fructicola]KAE9565720.1 hypothetical protein CGMCC3_g18097 [Colletotrichum fructicola]KAF4487497.1 hypothetical protein CGGC5_v005920 [Colletotrichum fructicola Nara gc5]